MQTLSGVSLMLQKYSWILLIGHMIFSQAYGMQEASKLEKEEIKLKLFFQFHKKNMVNINDDSIVLLKDIVSMASDDDINNAWSEYSEKTIFRKRNKQDKNILSDDVLASIFQEFDAPEFGVLFAVNHQWYDVGHAVFQEQAAQYLTDVHLFNKKYFECYRIYDCYQALCLKHNEMNMKNNQFKQSIKEMQVFLAHSHGNQDETMADLRAKFQRLAELPSLKLKTQEKVRALFIATVEACILGSKPALIQLSENLEFLAPVQKYLGTEINLESYKALMRKLCNHLEYVIHRENDQDVEYIKPFFDKLNQLSARRIES